MVDMVPMCQTVSCVTRIGTDESSDTSGTDTAVINGSDIDDFCQWPDLSDEEDCFVSDVGSSVDSSLCMSDRDDLRYADVFHLLLILIVRIRMWTFGLIRMRAPWRSWNGTLGMKRARWSFKCVWNFSAGLRCSPSGGGY